MVVMYWHSNCLPVTCPVFFRTQLANISAAVVATTTMVLTSIKKTEVDFGIVDVLMPSHEIKTDYSLASNLPHE